MKRLTSRKGASPYHPNLQDGILHANASDQCMMLRLSGQPLHLARQINPISF